MFDRFAAFFGDWCASFVSHLPHCPTPMLQRIADDLSITLSRIERELHQREQRRAKIADLLRDWHTAQPTQSTRKYADRWQRFRNNRRWN